MDIITEPLTQDSQKEIIDIFNYYVENSFAAYPEHKLQYEAFDHFLKMCEGYPAVIVKDNHANTLGFDNHSS